jgi:hypothetical protein
MPSVESLFGRSYPCQCGTKIPARLSGSIVVGCREGLGLEAGRTIAVRCEANCAAEVGITGP